MQHEIQDWPDVIWHVVSTIKARLEAENESICVYAGASAGVPNVDQVNVIRGTITPADEQDYCPQSDNEMKVYIEIWINETDEPVGDTDIEYENDRTMKGYQKLARCSRIARAGGFECVGGYESEYVRTEADDGEFRPVVAERIEYKVELKGTS